MRRVMLIVALGLSVLTVGSTVASAQTEISLGGTSQVITFTGLNSATQVSVTLGLCGGGACTLSGTGNGTGGLLSGPAPYSIITPSSLTITLTSLGGGLWSVTQGAGNILFSYGTGGSLLTGNLTLLSFSQTPGASTGDFNTLLQANLAITGGSLSGFFTPAGGILGFTVNFGSTTNILTLLNNTNSLSGPLSHGSITQTPEPGTMLLFGTGLVAVGGLLRRRLKT